MAVSMDALLKIQADVSGEGAVQNLARGIGNLNKQAGEASRGFKGLLGSTNGLSGALQSLIPLASGAGIAALVKSSIDAGDKMWDLSQKTGVSVEQLSKFSKAAKLSGTDIDTVGVALVRLAKNMQSAASVGKLGQKTKEEIDKAIQAVRDGERRQIEDVKTAAGKRVKALQDESDQRLSEISRRYRQEQKLLNDNFDDRQSLVQQSLEKEQTIEERGIEQRYDVKRQQIENDATLSDAQRKSLLESLRYQQEDEMTALRNRYSERSKEQSRALRDEQDEAEQAMQDRQKKEEEIVKKTEANKKAIIDKGASDTVYAIQKAADGSVKALKGTDGAGDVLSGELDDLGLSSSQAAKAFAELGVSVKNADGTLKNPGQMLLEIANRFASMENGAKKSAFAMMLLSRGGAELIPMLNMSGTEIDKLAASMTTKYAKAADLFNDKNIEMAGKIAGLARQLAEAMMPALIRVTDALIGFFNWFNELPGWAKSATMAIGGLVLAWGTLGQILFSAIRLAQALSALQFGATIAGWLGAVGPMIAGITAAFTGLLAWIGGTLIPGLLAFFSGPVGWTVLAVAAVVAMCIAFREPIGKFLTWFGEAWMNGLKTVAGFLKTLFVDPWIGLWNNVLRKPVVGLWEWFATGTQSNMRKVTEVVQSIWTGLIDKMKQLVNGFFQSWGDRINFVIDGVNKLIAGFNKLGPVQIQFVPRVPIPQFAVGGMVSRPTVGLVGEAGPEYIIPATKMASASQRFLAGARGADVFNGGGGAATPAPAQINITTGPVIEMGGQKYVSLADLEMAMRVTADSVIGQLRTPSARISLGLA